MIAAVTQNEYGASKNNQGTIAANALTKNIMAMSWKWSLVLGSAKITTDVTRSGSNQGQYDRSAAASGSRNLCGAMNMSLTIALERRGLRWRETELIYLNHRPSPWLTDDATPRSLEAVVRCHPTKLQPCPSKLIFLAPVGAPQFPSIGAPLPQF
jgi:hypothetical protein